MKVETATAILTHLSHGLTAAQIGAKIGLKTRTVEKYLEILRAVHRAENAAHLIGRAFRRKIIK